jgi:hypothetical protein
MFHQSTVLQFYKYTSKTPCSSEAYYVTCNSLIEIEINYIQGSLSSFKVTTNFILNNTWNTHVLIPWNVQSR